MQQIRVDYLLRGAPNEHPQLVMQRLAEELGFKIITSAPQSIADCWWFWIEFEERPKLPPYITGGKWLPVGSC